MSPPILSSPPDARTSYIIDQLEGERLTIPGSKGVFRILASSKQTNGGIAVFQSGAVLSDAPGFHWHDEAHDVFLVTKGFLKLWNDDKCRIMGPGDFAYVPPKVIHNPELLGPHTETFGLVAPGDWIDFFRYVGETYHGVIAPESDDRNLASLLIPKVMAAKDRFDVHFERDYYYTPPAVSDWLDSENQLPSSSSPSPYFLRANTGPRYLLGGLLSRPFITTHQTAGKFAISSLETSNVYSPPSLSVLLSRKWMTFREVDHCFCVQEGTLLVKLREPRGLGDDDKEEEEEEEEWTPVREGQTLVVSAGQAFALKAGSRFVRVWSFTNGNGIEELVHTAGEPCKSFVLPDGLDTKKVDDIKFEAACKELGVLTESLAIRTE
ncbi:quercetin 2,3-dioxygenase [Diplogelasinospora grovesii]|uniref:Quercetin 2,3-dioxygenase n=1 Tax=Diplogelasinospora grovesii TaxID=303347 RepID=A0AAN6NEB0_9PEZI|nr:quercetin 2,3-dioxygenase [Diplogelasinospora grovesii]